MPTLQEQINGLPSGGTLNVTGEFVENIVINKPLTLTGAKIVSPNADPAVAIPPRTRDVTLRNCEITGSGPIIHAIVEIGLSQMTSLAEVPTNITIDNCDIHGHATQEVQRGVAANGANVVITNSKIREIHGLGYDTQAICCWNGPGPFKITDNYLEAAGENVMFGGSPAAIPGLIPSDIEFRRNVVVKPLTWYPSDPSYAGRRWSIKNLFELKNARRVIVEGNIFDGNWTDAQAGRAIQFTPRPSDSGSWAVVEDVKFVNNIVRNTGAGLNVLGADEPPAPTETRLKRVRIANNLWLIDGKQFGSDGVFLVITNAADAVTVENNTVFHTGNIISSDYRPSTGFIYRNNISRHNNYGIFGSGYSVGNASIEHYFPSGIVMGNVIAHEAGGEVPSNLASLYPAGNLFPATLAEVFSDISQYKVAAVYAGKGADYAALVAAQGSIGPPTPLPSPIPPEPTPVPPAPEPTPTPAPAPSPAIPHGSRVEVISRVNVREGPSTSMAIKRIAEVGESGTTTSAPQLDVASGNTFVQVDFAVGDDGFVAVQFLKVVEQPAPTPIPPVPVPTPPPPTPAPCMMTASVIPATLSQWSNGKLVVNLSGLTGPATVKIVSASGQITVMPPTSKSINPGTATSAIVEFQLQAKKKSGTVTVSGPCGTQTVVVNVR